MSCDCGCSCNCSTVIQKGDIGPQGPQGIQGIQGIQGDPGESYTETNQMKSNVLPVTTISYGNPNYDDVDLIYNVTETGKYIICYSGNLTITANGNQSAGVNVIIRKNLSNLKNNLVTISYNSYVNLESRQSVNLFMLSNLNNGDVIRMRYERSGTTSGATMFLIGDLSIIRIS